MRQAIGALVGILCMVGGCSSFGSDEAASPSGLDAGTDAPLGVDAAKSDDAGGPDVVTDGGGSSSGSGRIAFVTSGKYSGNLGGVVGADAKCAGEASGASLPGTYKAWVSTGAQPAGARIRGESGPFVRTDGVRVAATLTASSLDAPIDHDAHGDVLSVTLIAWTGTTGSGNVASGTCADWTSASAADTGVAGLITGIKTDNWTSNAQTAGCNDGYRLYCVQD